MMTNFSRFGTSLLFIMLFSLPLAAEKPDTLIEDIEGNKHSLNDFIGNGKWVVLNVWATNCPYCRAELDTLNEFHHRHQEHDAMVIGLTLHWPSFKFPKQDELYIFAQDYFIDYPLLMVDGELANKLIGKPVDMIPLTFFYNPSGRLVYRVNGVVTDEILEAVIKQADREYTVEWAKVIPPEFKP